MVSDLGPQKYIEAPNIAALNHDRKSLPIHSLAGSSGFFLGFVNNLWDSITIRRIMWMQRHAHKFNMNGVHTALVCLDDCHTLYDFYISSREPLPFTLLSDSQGTIHDAYNFRNRAGLVLTDHQLVVQQTWLMSADRVWPRMHELLRAIENIEASSAA